MHRGSSPRFPVNTGTVVRANTLKPDFGSLSCGSLSRASEMGGMMVSAAQGSKKDVS